MKKTISLILALSLALALCACSEQVIDSAPADGGSQPPQTPVPVVDAPGDAEYDETLSLESLMDDFGSKIQAGSAGSSLKAVAQAARFMSWGVETLMSEEEIYSVVSVYMAQLDEAETEEYLMQIELLDATYQQLLMPGQEELLVSAGCDAAQYPWSDSPIDTVESFMSAIGMREVVAYTPLAPVEDDAYGPLIKDYRNCFIEGWEPGYIEEQGMNVNLFLDFQHNDPLNSLGYARYDINGDGVNELVIADMAEPGKVYGIYTQLNGESVSVFMGWARYNASVCSDGTVMARGSAGANNNGYFFYTLGDGGLNIFGSVMYDANNSPNSPWFVGTDDDWDITNDSPASEQQAQSLIAQYEQNYISFTLTPFSAETE